MTEKQEAFLVASCVFLAVGYFSSLSLSAPGDVESVMPRGRGCDVVRDSDSDCKLEYHLSIVTSKYSQHAQALDHPLAKSYYAAAESGRIARAWTAQRWLISFGGNNMGEVSVLGNGHNDVTGSSLSHSHSRAEALGDLFMDETYLQSNLDPEEITATAGLVSKEDLDVQRLVDVLWSQEIDLGMNREWLECALFPQVQNSKPTQLTQVDPSKDADIKADPFLLVSSPSTNTHGCDMVSNGVFIDMETGETMPYVSGNGTNDPGAGVSGLQHSHGHGAGANASDANLANQLTLSEENQTCAQQRMEERQLQSLIDALDSLNSSALEALGQAGQVDECWQDVQSVIRQPENSLSSACISTGNFDSVRDQILFPSESLTSFTDASPVTVGIGRGNGRHMDFLSMLVDPPSNWSATAVPHMSSNMQGNLTEYIFPPQPSISAGFNGSTITRILPIESDKRTDFRFGNSSSGSIPNTAVHEGPVDLSALSFTGFNWSSFGSSEWARDGSGMPTTTSREEPINSANVSYGQFPSLIGSDFFPPVNSSGNIFTAGSGSRSINNSLVSDWQSTSVIPQPQENLVASSGKMDIKENSLAWENQKNTGRPAARKRMQNRGITLSNPEDLPAREQAVEIKEEELDPWTDRASLNARHNHTYAGFANRLDKKESLQKPQEQMSSGSRSERSSYGSEGEGELDGTSQMRNRLSRDDRAAVELHLPLTANEIVAMPVEEFNNYIAGSTAATSTSLGLVLTAEQMQLMKDIRRRGKNKVAAQNCRRRKIDNMNHLEEEINALREELAQAAAHRDQLLRSREMYRAALRGPVIHNSARDRESTGGGDTHLSQSLYGKRTETADHVHTEMLRKRKRED